MRSCIATVGSMCAGTIRMRVPTNGSAAVSAPAPGRNVVCSSEQKNTSGWGTASLPSSDGLPWSMPNDLRPASTTAYPLAGDREMSVTSTVSAWRNGRSSCA